MTPAPTFKQPDYRVLTRGPTLLALLMFCWLSVEVIELTRPKPEPRLPAPIEIKENKVSRYEHN